MSLKRCMMSITSEFTARIFMARVTATYRRFVSGWILGSDATSVTQIENASSEVFFSIIGV
ncbi:hypothetical protein ALO70_102826 [Pseudomonas amygdali pv. eriobotryae]|uniref:Uncharacterized protein n=2 Tax=Pseudomonas amygdali TaxID=47877 RepID=A0A0Q0JT42_PSEA0|nr:hypothetical protein ALO70_102826 [Pseudomonas amygdali pv. eriobotryae]KPZ17434.1 hypothetical protein ALO41_102818 [Pseudomonas amygdali pv. ulmi]